MEDPNALSRIGTASIKIPVMAGKQAPPKKSKNHRQPITNHMPPSGQYVAEKANVLATNAKDCSKIKIDERIEQM